MIGSEDICRQVYSETRMFYPTVAASVGNLGYKILYGPPFLQPPILFIGFQPGGTHEDYLRELADGAQDSWAMECEYAAKMWKLARNKRRMFGANLLSQCVGLNAIFIRSPKAEIYKLVDPAVRLQIQNFCLPRVDRMIRAIQPRKIVANGFKTLDVFGGGTPDLLNARGNALTKVGRIAGQEAIATLHLSGGRISTADRDAIRRRVSTSLS